MEVITVNTSTKQYDVCIGFGAIEHLQSIINNLTPKVSRVLIITDDIVSNTYLGEIRLQLQHLKTEAFIIPHGEKSKSFEVYENSLEYAFEQKLDRNSLILALGGGVVGDLAGFVAASYMRGIRFIQIPTTLLAHDSAIGGKVAINLSKAKNIVGAFYQPEAVLYDLNFLRTLPQTEWRSGFAEIIKEAMISSKEKLIWLMNAIHSLENLDNKLVEQFITMGIQVKNKIVSEDEKENGVRAYLNLGHTLGHAIEAFLGYSKTTHGEAIAYGTLFSIYLSEKYFETNLSFSEILTWYKQLNYPFYQNLSSDQLIDLMKQDKKSVDLHINYILLEEFGLPRICKLDEKFIKVHLENFFKEVN